VNSGKRIKVRAQQAYVECKVCTFRSSRIEISKLIKAIARLRDVQGVGETVQEDDGGSARGQQPRSEELISISMEVLSPLFAIYILFYMNIAEQSCETIWPTLSISWTTKKKGICLCQEMLHMRT